MFYIIMCLLLHTPTFETMN